MKEQEIALHLATKVYEKCGGNLIETYFEYLDKLSAHKTDTLKGKLQELITIYDSKAFVSDFDTYNFIDTVKEIVGEVE